MNTYENIIIAKIVHNYRKGLYPTEIAEYELYNNFGVTWKQANDIHDRLYKRSI